MDKLAYHTPITGRALRALGIPDPWSYGTADRVRFGELDALNHVNHTAYFRWFETFRISYFRDYGISNYDADSPRIVLKSVTAEFLQEMTIAQDYFVTGRTTSFRNSSFVMDYAVWTEKGLMTTGSSVIVQLRQDGAGKQPLSETVRKTLIEKDGAQPVG